VSPPVRVLIADDEPAARRTLQLLLARDPELELVAECANGVAAVEAIERLRPDLVFLDIQMPGRDGFGVLAQLPVEARPLIVFVTAFDEYTLQAFEVHAADYLLKPFSDRRFTAAVSHAKERLRQRSDADLERLSRVLTELARTRDEAGDRLADRLAIRTAQGVFVLRLEEVDWIEARGDYVRIHSAGRADLVRDTIGSLEGRLPAGRFLRVHRSAIVNLDKVRELRTAATGEQTVVLQNGARCPLSRSGRERMERVLGRVP